MVNELSLNKNRRILEAFRPARIMDLELSTPLPAISQHDPKRSTDYTRAIVLVRLHTQPIGIIEVGLPISGLQPEELADQVWISLSGQINDHLRKDRLPLLDGLTRLGLPPINFPNCDHECTAESTRPLVSVVIATRDRAESLATTLDSILALDYPRYEVIVVDNAPKTEETYNLIRSRFSGTVQYIRENRPGLSVAHNSALGSVKGEIVAFTDDDVIADHAWLKRLVDAYCCGNRVACVTGMILSAELETPAQAIFEEYGGFSKGFTRKIFSLEEGGIDNILFPYSAGRYGSGANMSFKTDFLRALGGFDAAIGTGTPALGGDDLAAFFEVIAQGCELIYEPAAIIFHYHHRDYKKLRRQAFGYGAGLTAFLTKTIIDHPSRFFDIAWRIPSGLLYIFSPHSYKNVHKSRAYPKELNKAEYQGMLYGPLAYMRSRWQARKYARRFRHEASGVGETE